MIEREKAAPDQQSEEIPTTPVSINEPPGSDTTPELPPEAIPEEAPDAEEDEESDDEEESGSKTRKKKTRR